MGKNQKKFIQQLKVLMLCIDAESEEFKLARFNNNLNILEYFIEMDTATIQIRHFTQVNTTKIYYWSKSNFDEDIDCYVHGIKELKSKLVEWMKEYG